MAQIKIFGRQSTLATNAQGLSSAIHSAVVDALSYPPEKKFHRFLPLEDWQFVHPDDRSANYIIIEISMFEGRAVETKKDLIRKLFHNIEAEVGISPQDVEITIHESPKHDWGIRGMCGDELALGYKVSV